MDVKSLEPLMCLFLKDAQDGLVIDARDGGWDIVRLWKLYEGNKKMWQHKLQVESIPKLSKDELAELFLATVNIADIPFGPKTFLRNLFGPNDEELPALRRFLSNVVRLAQPQSRRPRFAEFLRPPLKKKWIGPAFLSEILVYRFPDGYWLQNSPVIECLEALFPEVHWPNELQEKYEVIGELLCKIGQAMDRAIGPQVRDLRRARGLSDVNPSDYLIIDSFVWWFVFKKRYGPGQWK
jgi:hypothetical protein